METYPSHFFNFQLKVKTILDKSVQWHGIQFVLEDYKFSVFLWVPQFSQEIKADSELSDPQKPKEWYALGCHLFYERTQRTSICRGRDKTGECDADLTVISIPFLP